jgi:hypothetical protein
MLQTHTPDSLEDARSYPRLESQMAGAAGTVFPGDHLPLAAGAQNIQNAVEYGTIRYPRPTVGSARLVRRQDGFDQPPQLIRNLAESTPLLGFLAHRNVLHDVTMSLSALMCSEYEGF